MTTARLPWKPLVPLLAVLGLSGCLQGQDMQRRIASTEQRIQALEQDLAEKDALIARVKQLQIQEARLSQQLSPPTVEALEAAFAPLPGMRIVSERSDAVIVTGRASLAAFAERLAELGSAQPGLQVQVLNVDGDALELQLGVVQPEDSPAPRRTSPLGMVLPWNRGARERLATLEARRVELASQLPEFVHTRGDLQWRINALSGLVINAHDSRRGMLGLAQVLTSPDALLAPLELEWKDGTIAVNGRARTGFAVEQLVEAGARHGWVLENVGLRDGWVRARTTPPAEPLAAEETPPTDAAPPASAEAPASP